MHSSIRPVSACGNHECRCRCVTKRGRFRTLEAAADQGLVAPLPSFVRDEFFDTVKNGGESDADCGGGTCPTCDNGKSCTAATDCASGGCSGTVCGPWSKAFGSTGSDVATGVVVDAAGNIVVVGSFFGTVDFGGGDLTASGANPDSFVVKLSPTGTYLWSRAFNGAGIDGANGVAVGPNGDVFVVGGAGSTDFGGGILPATGSARDALVVRLKGTDGSHMWSKLYGGTRTEEAYGVAVDASGDVKFGGYSNSASYSLGGATFTSAGGTDAFLCKVSGTDGAHVWSLVRGACNGWSYRNAVQRATRQCAFRPRRAARRRAAGRDRRGT